MSDWVDKIDIDLTGQAFTDELHNDVGASAFRIDHDWFWGEDLVIRTASGGGGTLLIEDTDYTITVEDLDLSARSGKSTFSRITIDNVTYQTGDLYFSGEYIGDSIEAQDTNDLYHVQNRRPGLNDIINGGMRFWQRGVSFAAVANGDYTADRWLYAEVGAAVHTITRDADVPDVDHQYSLKIDCTTADASVAAGDIVNLQQRIEGYNFLKCVGKNLTVSFWVKATKIGIHCFSLRNSVSDRSYVVEYEIKVTDTWEYKSLTIPLDFSGGTWDYTNGIGIILSWALMAGTTFQTTADAWQSGDYVATSNQVNACDNVANDFFLTGVKCELGEVATPFVLEDYQKEFARCHRYFQALGGDALDQRIGAGFWVSTTSARAVVPFYVPMRDAPSISYSAVSDFAFMNLGSSIALTALAVNNSSKTLGSLTCTVASGGNAGRGGLLIGDNNTDHRLYFDAEL